MLERCHTPIYISTWSRHNRITDTLLAVALALLAALGPVQSGFAYDRISGRMLSSRSPVMARHAMTDTSQPLAVQAALEVMCVGGNAVDTAIAMNAVLDVVEPTARVRR